MVATFPIHIIFSPAPRTLPHLSLVGLEPYQLASGSLVAQALDVKFSDAAVQPSIERLGDGRQVPVSLGKDGDLRLFTTVFGANDEVREGLVHPPLIRIVVRGLARFKSYFDLVVLVDR